MVLVMLMVVVGIALGQNRSSPDPREQQGDGERTHGKGQAMVLRCSLPLEESQVVVAAPLKIGEVAQRSGLTIKTIRFYCDQDLIQPSSRSEGGYRLFGDEVFAELALIRTLKAMDIPLQNVTQILESRRSRICTCESLKATIRSKAGEIEQKIDALHNLRQELNGLLSSWEDCGGRKPSAA